MCSRFRRFLVMAALVLAGVPCMAAGSGSAVDGATSRVLRVAADPNNLPFSNDTQQGFENKIAELVARELGAKLEYNWYAQRRGFFRNTLKANKADLVLGVPAGFEMARPTKPIYSSSYVFVSRADRNITVKSLDDPELHRLKVGVQLIGDDGTNTPPAHALARRSIINNVRGYTVYGDYSKANPAARIMDAVANGEVDIAIVWGPLAGFFSSREPVPLNIVPVTPVADGPALPMAYSICAGVRKGDDILYEDIQQALVKLEPEIQKILTDYQVPLVDQASVPVLFKEDDDD